MGVKSCTACFRSSPEVSFHVNRARKDGLMAKCTTCMKSYRAGLSSSLMARAKAVERTRQWRLNNPITDARREHTNALNRERYQKNPRYLIRARIKNHVYRAHKRNVLAESFDPRAIFDRDNWLCHLCHQPVDAGLSWPDVMSATLDHLVPLSRGGTHERQNVALAHLRCNSRKGNRSIDPPVTTVPAVSQGDERS